MLLILTRLLKTQVGLSLVPNLQQNLAAAVDPTVNDDVDLGYSIGSFWYNTTDDEAFVLLDATDGAAVWIETTAGAGSGEINTISSQGGGTFALTAATPKSGVDLRVISVSNGDGMNASLAADVLTLAVASTVVQTNKTNTFGDFAQNICR